MVSVQTAGEQLSLAFRYAVGSHTVHRGHSLSQLSDEEENLNTSRAASHWLWQWLRAFPSRAPHGTVSEAPAECIHPHKVAVQCSGPHLFADFSQNLANGCSWKPENALCSCSLEGGWQTANPRSSFSSLAADWLFPCIPSGQPPQHLHPHTLAVP